MTPAVLPLLGLKLGLQRLHSTDWHKTQFRPNQVVLILRGFAQGRSTAGLARELRCRRAHLLARRHRMRARALAATEAGATPLPDGTVEADEMDQNAAERRGRTTTPRTRRGAVQNKAFGHGTRDNDRVPVAGAVGRDSDRLDLKVVRRPSRAELVDAFVLPATAERAAVSTDEGARTPRCRRRDGITRRSTTRGKVVRAP